MQVNKKQQNQQLKVQNVFKQLLERIAIKKSVNRKDSTNMTPFADKQYRSKSLAVSLSQQIASPIHSSKISQLNPFKITCFGRKKCSNANRRVLAIKGSVSNRFGSEPKISDRLVDHKIQQYNQLLVTKSYIFSQLQNKRKKSYKHSKTQTCNFQKNHKANLPGFNLQKNMKTHLNAYKQAKLRKTLPFQEDLVRHNTQGCHRNSQFQFQPWQTNYKNDFY